MSNIQTFLQNILSARYGKDVRQSIHDAIEEIDSVASTAKDSAVNSAESARKSAESASNNAGQAEQFRNEAEQFRNEAEGFVPENYTELVHTVEENAAKINEVGDKIEEVANKTEENAIKIDTIIEKAELNIKNTASGKDIRLTDSADGKVVELALYGKSKQGATTGKSLTANIMKNTTSNGITFTLNENGSVSMNGESTDNISLSVLSFTSNFTGMVKLSGCSGSNYWLYAWDNSRGKRPFKDSSKTDLQTNNQYAPNKELSFYVEEGVNYSVFFRGFPGYKYENEVMFPMLSIEGGEYEPYTGGLPSPSPEYPQDIEVSGVDGNVEIRSTNENGKETVAAISTPNGLVGISAENGGNYTDETGQQWVCDEIVKYADGTGERVQRIKKIVFDGENVKFSYTRTIGGRTCYYSSMYSGDMRVYTDPSILPNIISNCLIRTSRRKVDDKQLGEGCYIFLNSNGSKDINMCFNEPFNSVADANAWLVQNPVEVYYELAEPIRTPLATEEIAEFEKLHTFYPITNITNDSECDMKVTYLADLKKYTDNQLALQAQAQEAAMLNMLLLLPEETQAAMIEKDTNNLLMESEE